MQAMRTQAIGLTALAGFLALVSATVGQSPRAGGEEAGIRQALKGLADGFAAGNASQAAGAYSENAELYLENGPPVRGKAAIRAAYAVYFKNNSGCKVALEPHALRFLSKDAAMEDGLMRVSADGKETVVHKYSILLLREEGKWLVAMVRESPAPRASLLELEWLVGNWQAKQGANDITSKYEWMEGKTFLKCNFQVREKDKVLHGLRLIGLDPASGELKIWTFETHGGVGTGTIRKDGNRWVIEAVLNLPDGVEISSSTILSQVNEESFSWLPTQVKVNELSLPDLPPIVVRRVKTK